MIQRVLNFRSNSSYLISCRLNAVALLILFCCTFTSLFAQPAVKISVEFESRPLKEVLEKITLLSGFEFAYSDTEINSSKLISISAKEQKAEEIIRQLAMKAGLEASFVGKKVLLKPAVSPTYFQVSGTVKDFQNMSLPGANITFTDTLGGTVADSNGNFTLKVSHSNPIIRISFIGFTPEVVKISNDTLLNIHLEPEIQKLGETVVVAFGSESKDLVSGSVSYLKMDMKDQANNSSLNAALQSQLTGLQIQPNGGTPGSAMNVNIRGISSINAGNKPLYIVDGIPVITGDYSQLDFSGQAIDAISDLNVNDIESVSVLKDAAASSLFGSNSSNGVILINTKHGIANHHSITFHSQYGIQQTTGMLDMLNASQYMNLMNEKAISSGKPSVYSSEDIAGNRTNTNWQKEVFRLAPTFDIGLSLRGGNNQSKYYLSGNYFNQQGILIGSDFSRYNLQVNYDYRINDRLNIETGNGFAYSINNRVEGDQSLNGPLPNAISLAPVLPVYNSDGSFNNDGFYANPVSIAKLEKNLAFSYRNTFHFKVSYDLFRNFRIQSLSGLDFYSLGEQTFAPKTTRQGFKYNGLGIEATSNALRFYHTSYADYALMMGQNQLSFTAGFSFESNKQHDVFLRAQNFPGTSFKFLQDAATPIATQSFETDSRANSLFSRVKYSLNDLYFFTLNMRYDGSSKFGENNRFAFFPSVSGLWYLSRESFFRSKSVSKLIISASYGITGNDQIGNFMSLDLFSAGNNYNGEGGISPSQLANPDLKWESTNHFNFGTQLELLGGLTLRADYYRKRTKDLLLQKPMATSSGYAFVLDNIGKLRNRGFEASLEIPVLKQALKWNAVLNFTSNRNEVVELYRDQPIHDIGRAGSSISVGEPVSYFYGFNSLGVNPADGNLIYEDLNSDGKITDIDRKKIGSPHPDFYGGLGSNFSYKCFEFDVLFSFSYGNEIFNSTRVYTETLSQSNQTTAVRTRWQKPGDISTVPKAGVYNQRISSRFVEDGSFLRMKNIRLSYDFPANKILKYRFSALQLFVAGKNLLTFTKYSGIDPEVNYNGHNSMTLGTDFFTCPQAKSLILGLCAKF